MGKRSRETSFSPFEGDLASSQVEADPFFEPNHPVKCTHIDNPASGTRTAVMQCDLPPHQGSLAFDSVEDYEVHYLKEHTYRCSSCGRNFPSGHFLGLHMDERHNVLRETLQERGEKTFGCFVEGCDRKCSTPAKRRLHLIDKHGFPKLYNFRVVEFGIDKSSSMLTEGRRRRVSLTSGQGQVTGRMSQASSIRQTPGKTAFGPAADLETDLAGHRNTTPGVVVPEASSTVQSNNLPLKQSSLEGQDEMSDLAKNVSALRFVPTSVLLRQSSERPE